MADINEQNDLYPSMEEIEGLEIAILNKEEDALERDEDQDDAVEGIGDLGRARRKQKRQVRRVKRSVSRKNAVKRSYNAGAKSTAVKTGLTRDLTSKGQFELRRQQLPPEIQKALKDARMQTVDAAIYTIKSIKDRSDIDLMEASDDKKTGRTNLNRAQLDSGKYFLLTDIVLEYAHGSSEDDNDPADYSFGQFAFPPQMINGTFEMTLGTKVILPEISCAVFDDSDTNKRKFLYKLANPKWLKPSMDITPKLNMPKAVTGDKVFNPAVKITLLGTMTEKA
ncbi:hypothetical protein [Gaoshiqia sediminis]|jgi:hypothetical protein|uniref:Uncharacterized protein n=1 Tax=Gaoshiqia sediminis TaxID=2986998 RepID=A0AA42CAF4_9BACT|nr:hypothetical protein [Gaoshiqia sediminis]MCU4164166.1 hypothetical protein [Marinilabiliaceae bacterium A049]MCW0483692.1 hypothetical protein [Gaoshiqia sediminis]PKP08628.1 MAG: hypothetical protein CVU09_14885 [Bacteroidetes bacterium HGW-Bacteroidetes-4]